MFLIPRSYPETETGAMKPSTCYAHACTVAEVEVDDETGEVTVVSVKNVFEIGRALNPKMVEQQLVGGSWMGISHALYETTEPYYPNRDHGGTDFNEYLMPGPGDLAETEIIVLERPSADGPYGAKGPGEMCANPQIPAVANAVFDAVGVRIDTLPITPERILRALKAQRARGALSDDARTAPARIAPHRPRRWLARLAEAALSRRRRPGDRHLPRDPARQAAAARRRAGRRQDRGRQGDRRHPVGCDLVRLQCYEGIDAAHALYEWNYQRQLLAIRQAGEREIDIYDDRFLIARPLLQVLQAPDATVAAGRRDRPLATTSSRRCCSNSCPISRSPFPSAARIARQAQPIVVLTSNRTRELAEALRRRCVYHWIAYPDAAREAAIIMLRAGDVAEATAARGREGRRRDPRQAAGQAARHRRGGRMGQCRDRAGKGRQPLAGSLPPRDRRADQGRGGHAAISLPNFDRIVEEALA